VVLTDSRAAAPRTFHVMAKPTGSDFRMSDGEPGLRCLCTGYQSFFRHVDEHGSRIPAGIAPAGTEGSNP
jgi:hypothetical protein